MTKRQKILILGANGLVGQNAMRLLSHKEVFEVIGLTKSDLDLKSPKSLDPFLRQIKPDILIFAAAVVGGIKFNKENPTKLLLDNLMISTNVINSALTFDIRKFINFGSSCMFPLNANQPFKVESLMHGLPELSSIPYATYKLATWKLIDSIRSQYNKNWITIIPSTIYGPYDNFSSTDGHVISSLISKFHHAKLNEKSEIELWGDGSPLREFIYVEDLISAIEFIIENDIDKNIFNIGSNNEISIKNLAELISEIVAFKGKINWNLNQPNGASRKLLDSSFINSLGWKAKKPLSVGLIETYEWFKNAKNLIRT